MTKDKASKLHMREWDEYDEVDQVDDVQEDDQEEEEEEESDESCEEQEKQDEDDNKEGEGIDENDDDEEDESNSEDKIDITKKRCDIEQEDDYGEDSEEEEEEDDDEEEEDILNVDVEFKDANETMFYSVKALINGYLDGSDYSSSELANLIVKQFKLGTFIVIEEEEEENQKKIREKAKLEKETNCIGFCTMLSTKQHAKEAVVAEILKFANEKSQKYNSDSDHKIFTQILEKNRVGLLINERIINVAPQTVPVLHTQVLEDHKWLKENHPKEFMENFNFEYLLCITRCSLEAKQARDPQLGHKKLKKEELENYLYPKFEDFCLLEKAEIKFLFEAAASKSQSGLSLQKMDEIKSKETPYRAIYLIKFSDYIKTVPEISFQLCN